MFRIKVAVARINSILGIANTVLVIVIVVLAALVLPGLIA